MIVKLNQIRVTVHYDSSKFNASEEAGMEQPAEILRAKHPELKVSFIPTGEVYRHL